jgi:hypothetical protein
LGVGVEITSSLKNRSNLSLGYMNRAPDMHECDIAIIGGGLGGVAAALAAAEAGNSVILTEEFPWIGGQATSQAVSALDEHRFIDSLPGTPTYAAFRENIRKYYQREYHAPAYMPDGDPLNPGNGWVSRLCFQPRAGLHVLNTMLAPYIENEHLCLFLRHRPVGCEGDPTHLSAVRLASQTGKLISIRARYFIDATELGDLLPLAGIPYVTGAEAYEDTLEPQASRDGPHPERVQSFTLCFLVEFCPGQDHTIRKPRNYTKIRQKQPYSLTLYNHLSEAMHYRFFEETEEGLLPFWTYRRVFDASLLAPQCHDITLINWNANDYRWGNLIDQPSTRKAAILNRARQLSQGFLYWLQTEVRRDDGKGYGYPELKLLPKAVGTRSGVAMAPYIRESRRILGMRRILEQDIVANSPASAEGMQILTPTNFPDTAGIGWYAIDLHPCVGDEAITGSHSSMYVPTRPFQIPLGALIPPACDNLLAACKNIATTHLTNGAYRLHHTEWSIGEAAGSLAAWCCGQASTPHAVWESPVKLANFQAYLRRRGVTLEWPKQQKY